MTSTDGPTPLELIDGSYRRVKLIHDRPPQPPGAEWHFALGILFALTTTRQLDDATSERYDELLHAEKERISRL